MLEIERLYTRAGDLRSKIGHGLEGSLTRREAFDLCQLVEALSLYLLEIARSQIEVD